MSVALNRFRLTNGQGPIYSVPVVLEGFREIWKRVDRLGWSEDRHTLIQPGRGPRHWQGYLYASEELLTTTVDDLAALYDARCLYLQDTELNDNVVSLGQWARVIWTGPFRVEWEEPVHRVALVSFEFVEVLGH